MPSPDAPGWREMRLAQLVRRFESRVGALPGPMPAERPAQLALANLACVLEIGSLGGLLPDPLPGDVLRELGGHVSQLESRPPWPAGSARGRLLALFRRRVDGQATREDGATTGDEGRVAGAFSEFLALTDALRDDPRVTAFIEALRLDEARWSEAVAHFLMDGEEFRGAMQSALAGDGGTREPQTSAAPRFAAAVVGAATYVTVMEAIKGVLDLVTARPMFRSAMWHYHAPAFAPPRAVERLDILLSFTRRQLREAGLPDEDVQVWAADGEAAVAGLRAEEYATPIARLFRVTPGESPEAQPEGYGERLREELGESMA